MDSRPAVGTGNYDGFHPEFVEALPTLPARIGLILPGSINAGHRYRLDLSHSRHDGRRDGARLGAHSGRIRGVLDIHAGIELAVVAHRHGPDPEMGVRGVGILRDGSGLSLIHI